MPRYKIIVEYDGAPFSGWQYQENSPSVQRAIMTAIEAFSGEKVMVQGAGRTDAGVHALGQVAHFDLASERDTDTVRTAKCFMVPRAEIEGESYDLSLSRYKQDMFEEVHYDTPGVILDRLIQAEVGDVADVELAMLTVA